MGIEWPEGRSNHEAAQATAKLPKRSCLKWGSPTNFIAGGKVTLNNCASRNESEADSSYEALLESSAPSRTSRTFNHSFSRGLLPNVMERHSTAPFSKPSTKAIGQSRLTRVPERRLISGPRRQEYATDTHKLTLTRIFCEVCPGLASWEPYCENLPGSVRLCPGECWFTDLGETRGSLFSRDRRHW